MKRLEERFILSKDHQKSFALGGEHIRLSIIVPCYNPGTKISKCLDSLSEIALRSDEFEVIFIDDASTDDTPRVLHEACRLRDNWQIIEMNENTGSPSGPRNRGIDNARGDFVFFLDCDDEIISSIVDQHLVFAEMTKAEVVRSPLVVDHGGQRVVLNGIEQFASTLSKSEKVRLIISKQSSTNSSLVKREFLIDSGVYWPEGNHMGEDTIFLTDLLQAAENIEYFDEPTIVYHKTVGAVKSATQRYGSRELRSHLKVWAHAEAVLKEFGVSYMEVRGEVAVAFALKNLIRFGTGDVSSDDFLSLSRFIRGHWESVSKFRLAERFQSILDALYAGDFVAFVIETKPRLVVAGYDLKFIRGALPILERFFTIKVDEWSGHDVHDELASRECVNWADVVFCEWMLGNAVWYSKHKRRDQTLIVRMHRFELTRAFGNAVVQKAVDAFIAVSVGTLEEMIQTFHYDRRKCRVVSNFLQLERFGSSTDPDRVFRLALVGTIPARKGYRRALELLHSLRVQDNRYTLTLFGKRPDELPWVARDNGESAYFRECDQFVMDNQLEGAIVQGGWVSTPEVIHEYGFVLSTSHAESFHLAPGESFAAGNQGVFLPWAGVEFVFPDCYIFEDIYAMRDYVLSNRRIEDFERNAKVGKDHVGDRFSVDRFIEDVRDLVLEVGQQ